MKNNRDRGAIKWTAMMLPEHVEELKKWQEENDQAERSHLNEYKRGMIFMRAVPKPPKTIDESVAPKLEEHDFIEIGEKIAEALEFGTEVEVTIYFEEKHESFRGIITSADPQIGVLKLYMGTAGSISINVMSIVGIK